MTISNITRYERPENLATALRLLQDGQGRAVPLAGGTALLGAPPREVESVVDLSGLKLDWISPTEAGGLSLGAMVTLAALMASEEGRGYAGGTLVEAMRYSAGNLVRNRATLGGTLIGCASSSDLVALLLALGATVVLYEGTEREIELSDLYRRRAYHLQPGSLLTEVRLPALPAGSGVSLQRVARTPMDQPILTVAACATRAGARLGELRLAASALGNGADPARLSSAESALRGTELGSSAFDVVLARAADGLAIQGDHLASADYRRAMIPVLVRRALEKAAS
ncbi:MAG: FAD binding domain-containing protein [Ardenticatenales bacterium]|nr:FAD binding domain-containing protein [Ardenticatenales bacterium]